MDLGLDSPPESNSSFLSDFQSPQMDTTMDILDPPKRGSRKASMEEPENLIVRDTANHPTIIIPTSIPSTHYDKFIKAKGLNPQKGFGQTSSEICICGKVADFECSDCSSQGYCSVVCQRADWPAHAHNCRQLQQKFTLDMRKKAAEMHLAFQRDSEGAQEDQKTKNPAVLVLTSPSDIPSSQKPILGEPLFNVPHELEKHNSHIMSSRKPSTIDILDTAPNMTIPDLRDNKLSSSFHRENKGVSRSSIGIMNNWTDEGETQQSEETDPSSSSVTTKNAPRLIQVTETSRLGSKEAMPSSSLPTSFLLTQSHRHGRAEHLAAKTQQLLDSSHHGAPLMTSSPLGDLFSPPAMVAERRTLHLKILGVRSPGQAQLLEELIYKMDGILTSSVDFESSKAKFRYDAELLDETKILKTIEKEGYRALPLPLSEETNSKDDQCASASAHSNSNSFSPNKPKDLEHDHLNELNGSDLNLTSSTDAQNRTKILDDSLEQEMESLMNRMKELEQRKREKVERGKLFNKHKLEEEQQDFLRLRQEEYQRQMERHKELEMSHVEAFGAEDACFVSAQNGEVDAISYFLQCGGDVNSVDANGRTMLIHCAHFGHNSCLEYLSLHGANPNHKDNSGATAMHYAAQETSPDTLQTLLDAGASPNIRDNHGRTPLHWSTNHPRTACLAFLAQQKKVDINAISTDGMTSLMYAAFHERPHHLAKLLNLGADTEEKDCEGKTVAHWAVHKSTVDCLRHVLTLPSTFYRDDIKRTVMHTIAETGGSTACKMVLALRPDAVNDEDRYGRTPLHYASVSNNPEVLYILLQNGGNKEHEDLEGFTPLYYAEAGAHETCINLLRRTYSISTNETSTSTPISVSSPLPRGSNSGTPPLSSSSPFPQNGTPPVLTRVAPSVSNASMLVSSTNSKLNISSSTSLESSNQKANNTNNSNNSSSSSSFSFAKLLRPFTKSGSNSSPGPKQVDADY